MENILQSIVKIIIIGLLYKTGVDCNRQFLVSPPLPYYQNENYYVSGFAPVYQEPLPVYYPERNAPPPVSYQNINSYTPPQLFYQNENYIPPTAANPGLRYPLPPVAPHKQSFQQQYKPQAKPNIGFPRVSYSKPLQPQRAPEVSQKKTEAFASNIIVKEEPLSPYYQDDYGKNYNDDDYSDNYTDESPTGTKPCVTASPYRFFEAPKDIPNSADKYTLCNPYFQPNFGNSVYTVKMPITLLPSRFPPRVEQLIERIQNYFSTYTQQQTQKPQNETLPSSTPQTTISESVQQLSTTEEVHKKNKTGENEQETTTQSANGEDLEQLTETFVLELEANEPETSSTSVPDAQEKKEEVQTTQKVEETTESVSEADGGKMQSTEAAVSGGGQPVGGAEIKIGGPVEVKESSTAPEEVTKAIQPNNDQTTGSYDDVTSNNG